MYELVNVTKTYSVKLTVTDNSGATGTVTNPVTVTHVNVAPTAAFTSTVAGSTWIGMTPP